MGIQINTHKYIQQHWVLSKRGNYYKLKMQIKSCAEMNVKELGDYVNSTIIGKIKKSKCTTYIYASINKT